MAYRFIRRFAELRIEDVPLVGGKNASLGEMYRELKEKGIEVPDGFAVTAEAYRYFFKKTRLDEKVMEILKGLNTHDLQNLQERGARARAAILREELPLEIREEILQAYHELSAGLPQGVDVAVRSSATAEDLPDASFAGQQETYLNVRGDVAVLEACRRCFASVFTDRAISYRHDKGFDHFKVALSVGIQRMVRSDLASSGVMFSIDTETGFRDVVLINAAYGLGENVVQGTINPDEYVVFKPTLMQGFRPILQKKIGTKEFKLVYDEGGQKMVKNVPVPEPDRKKFVLSDEEILTLSRWAIIIEDHYSKKRNVYTPMDMEWAKDGISGKLYIVQARPETVQSRKDYSRIEIYTLRQRGKVLVTGRSVGEKIATGPVRVVKTVAGIHAVKEGDILVTDRTDPDWEPAMKKAAAIVTNRGGRTCHAAIVSRELGVPAIVGTINGTDILKDGQRVTVSCAEGDTGYVYEGELPFEREIHDFSAAARPKTKIMMNIGNPEEVFRLAQIPNDGVGLARLEFIITSYIGIHPLALCYFDKLPDGRLKERIMSLTVGYENKEDFFVDNLARGIGMIAAAFYPKDVIVRLSDFKTNEYANLIGGELYEPKEENPMIGFRGASRYYHERYRDGFALECRALKKVRDEMGLTNVKIMVPFCRTVEEGRKVIAEMEKHGLRRGENGLEIYVMCEIPANVILAEEFAQIFDGFSIGSNDLTQLILGVDRDSEIVASIFDERNAAVKAMIAEAIRKVRAAGKKIGICGQAPSDYPEFAAFLVEQEIHSISLNPDVVLKTTARIMDVEQKLGLR
ncbi:MAG: phosphoenolpyruvate synthase [Leptospiraceae bacterium]|nr:phosphoenolpyruvate synthase [Leptospiraceae bacterium]MDW8307462.1 phosphoenolpyruvate synthase [Leptospiraceae bacterium]